MTNLTHTFVKLTSAFNERFSREQSFIKALATSSLLTLSACASVGIDHPNYTQKVQESGSYVNEFPQANINQIAQRVTKDTFKPGDIADVNVYNVETLTNTYVVDRSGNINFPLIGTVKVSELSTNQLQDVLTHRYGEEYLQVPSINVKIETESLGNVVIDGAVNKPGVYEVADIINLSEAVALAEGLNIDDTNGGSIFIIRNIENERKVVEVDIREIRQFGAADPQVLPDDIIFVQTSPGRKAFQQFLKTVPLLNTVTLFSIRR